MNLKNEVGIETLFNLIEAFRSETRKRLEVLERSAQPEGRTPDGEIGTTVPGKTVIDTASRAARSHH